MKAAKSKPKRRERSAYQKEYYQRRREELLLAKHEHYLEIRDEHIAHVQKNAGGGKRMVAGRPIRRRWLVIGDRAYVSSRLGLSMAELLRVLAEVESSGKREVTERDRARESQHLYFTRHREKIAEKAREYRETVLGSERRPDPPVGKRIVLKKRLWLVHGTRIYFNAAAALRMPDLLKAVGELQEAVAKARERTLKARPPR